MEAISIVKIILFICAICNYSHAERSDEPVCYSTFDFHEKVLEKLVKTEHKVVVSEEGMNSLIETFKSDMNHMTETLAKMEQKQDEMTRTAVDREIRMSQELNNTLETVMKDVKNISAKMEQKQDEMTRAVVEGRISMSQEFNNTLETAIKAVKDISATRPSAFMAHGVSTGNPGDGETIIFTNVLLNLGEGYDPTTGIFTAHTPGVYQFSVQIYAKYTTAVNIYVQMRKNSATVVGSFCEHTSVSEIDSFTGVAVVQLEAGDTVSTVRTGGTSSPIHTGNPTSIWNSFSGTLVTVIQ